MTVLSVSVLETAVFAALRAYLVGMLDPSVEVIQSQQNRVPGPLGPTYILMTPANRSRLAVAVNTWDITDPDPTAIVIEQDIQYDMQLDIHGPGASDIATLIAATFFDDYAQEAFAGTGVTPLFTADGRQMPFLNAEQQYENRWVIVVSMQINPLVSTSAQFAATLTPTVYPALGGS